MKTLWLYWEEKDRCDLERSNTFEEHGKIAFRIISRMPRPIAIVCGPISTGGAGSIEENLRIFSAAIEELRSKEIIVFSQIPFEDAILKIKNTPYYKGGMHLLETFYLPLFELVYVDTFYFIERWETSLGASWERFQAKRLKKKIIDL